MALPVIIGLASLGLGAYSMIKSNSDKRKAEAEFKKQMASRPQYQPSESSKKLLNDTESQRNAIDPSVMLAYQQAAQQAASQQANAQRNATSGAEALSAGSVVQNNFHRVLPNLMSAQNNFSRANRQSYYDALTNYGRQEELVAADNQAKHADALNFQLGRMAGANASQAQGMQLAASGLSSVASYQKPSTNATYDIGGRQPEYIQPITNQQYSSQVQMPVLSNNRYMMNGRFNPYTNQWETNY